MTVDTFIDTCALANEITVMAYRVGLLQDAVVLKSVQQEIAALGSSIILEKQQAGCRALSTLESLRALEGVHVIMDNDDPLAPHTDDDLIKRAWITQGRIFTADYKLVQQATLHNIEVIPVQKIRQQLRFLHNELLGLFPPVRDISAGEIMRVRVVKSGTRQGQGVAYLPDGRKIVINDGQRYMGQELDVCVDWTLKESDGSELIFATPVLRVA